jgi:hypothetical protein
VRFSNVNTTPTQSSLCKVRKTKVATLPFSWCTHHGGIRQLLPCFRLFTITSVLYAPLKRSQTLSDAKTAKRDVFPRVNRKNASGTFSARCMTMHESDVRSVWAHTVPIRHIFGHFQFVNPWLIAAYQTRAILGAPLGSLCKKMRHAPRAAPTLINCFFYR